MQLRAPWPGLQVVRVGIAVLVVCCAVTTFLRSSGLRLDAPPSSWRDARYSTHSTPISTPPGIEHMAWHDEQRGAVVLRACDSGVPLGEDEQCSHVGEAGQVMLMQCTIVPGHAVANRDGPSPHRLCLNSNASWGVCSHGMFLCEESFTDEVDICLHMASHPNFSFTEWAARECAVMMTADAANWKGTSTQMLGDLVVEEFREELVWRWGWRLLGGRGWRRRTGTRRWWRANASLHRPWIGDSRDVHPTPLRRL